MGAAADEANLDAVIGQYGSLLAEIREVDPSFVNDQLSPEGGIDALSWQERSNLIDGLRMQRAAAYYRMRGDLGRLQVETLRFLQKAVDAAYGKAVAAADGGRLQPRLSRQEAIGNDVDARVRREFRDVLRDYKVPYGPQQDLTINNRDYATTDAARSYRVPDARLRDIVFDWTISEKNMSTPQIRGFFQANSQPRAVVIVRPSQLGRNSTYMITRPAGNSP